MPLDLPALPLSDIATDVDTLIDNVRGVVTVDMANGNYTMTNAEANASTIFLIGVASGKTLTWPTTSDSTRPAMQLLATIFASYYVTLAAQSGGGTTTVSPGTVHLVGLPDGFGAFNIDNYFATDARNASNGNTTLAVGNTNLADSHGGDLLIAADGAAQTLTINTGLLTANFLAQAYCSGAGGLTIQAGLGVTVQGNAVLATGQSCWIRRQASTETYICV